MLRVACLFILAVSAVLTATSASASKKHYGLTISTASTYNVSFNNGVFTATGDNAVLSVTDLKIALQQGNIVVTTGNGPGGDEQGDLHIETVLNWNTATSLSLDAYHSIFVDQPVSDDGAGGMSIVTDDGGSEGFFSIGKNGHSIDTVGHITFANLSDALSINGTAYTLVGSIQSLAAAIAANPSSAYALAADYDASSDGTYRSSPVSTFTGNFDGLGNVISHLTIRGAGSIGFFSAIESPATVSHFTLRKLNVTTWDSLVVGGLAPGNTGTLLEDSISGTMSVFIPPGDGPCDFGCAIGGMIGLNSGPIDRSSTAMSITFIGPHEGGEPAVGGLVGEDEGDGLSEPGTITNSHASGTISTRYFASIGGLVGAIYSASIATSYATGDISCVKYCDGGGLVGDLDSESGVGSTVENSYTTGKIAEAGGREFSNIGGLIGANNGGSAVTSYSTGAPTGSTNSAVGGFIGSDYGSLTNCYWDTDTSGITNLSQGAGYPVDDPGITGLTTAQFQSGLPAGFDPAVWAEKAKINGGLPFLRDNPPPK